MESMQDLFQANYSSPYEGEDRQGTINSFASNKRKRNQSSSKGFLSIFFFFFFFFFSLYVSYFLSKSFLENY
jgi:hypothetical protein